MQGVSAKWVSVCPCAPVLSAAQLRAQHWVYRRAFPGVGGKGCVIHYVVRCQPQRGEHLWHGDSAR